MPTMPSESEKKVSLRQAKPGRGGGDVTTTTLKPFIGTLRVRIPPGRAGRQPETSLAWRRATAAAKRRQSDGKPGHRASKVFSSGALVVDTSRGRVGTPHGLACRSHRGPRPRRTVRRVPPGTWEICRLPRDHNRYGCRRTRRPQALRKCACNGRERTVRRGAGIARRTQ
jgi:hypothetical protein